MGVLFSASELIDIAIGIERSGAVFYDSLARSARNEIAKGIYEHLAREERRHLETFQRMLASLTDSPSSDTYTEEYDHYLKALVDSAVFTDDQAAREMAQKVSSDAEAIQIALGAEKDSILFYSNLRDLVFRTDREVIHSIIEEEMSHVRQLTTLKESLSKL